MAGKQAKILSNTDVQDLLVYATSRRYPHRNVVIVLLSIKAGLRAGEIAKLTWDMVLDPRGEVGTANRAARSRRQETQRYRLDLHSPKIARLVPGSRPAALAINAKDDDECCI